MVAAAGLGHLFYQNSSVPQLGVVEGHLKPLSSKPNCVSTQAASRDKLVPVLEFRDTAEVTMAALLKAVESHGGGRIQTQTEDYLYVVFSTSAGFRDDVEFWLDGDKREVHFRSASRAGYSDMGVNRKRYKKLAELYASSSL